MSAQTRRIGAWLGLAGLLLQVGLGAVHSARHFDHLVGHLVRQGPPLAAAELASDPGSPSPGSPFVPELDHCAFGLALAAAGSGVLVTPDILPLPPARQSARLDGERQTIAAPSPRHLLPPARAPPVVVISA